MSNIAIKGAATGTGVFTLESPATNTNRTLTLPDEAGTILTTATAGVPIGGPAFNVGLITSNQNISAATYTKVQFNDIVFDTNSCWDETNYRFLPTVAGYYQINLVLYCLGNTFGEAIAVISKNNVHHAWSVSRPEPTNRASPGVSSLVYMNGSTDYIEGYAYIQTGTVSIGASSARTQMSGSLVRSAT